MTLFNGNKRTSGWRQLPSLLFGYHKVRIALPALMALALAMSAHAADVYPLPLEPTPPAIESLPPPQGYTKILWDELVNRARSWGVLGRCLLLQQLCAYLAMDRGGRLSAAPHENRMVSLV